MSGVRRPPQASRPVVTSVASLAVAAASLTLAVTTAAPTLRLLSTADGRRFLQDAPTDTVAVSVVHLGLVAASAMATVVLGAVLLTDLVARRPRGRLARWTPTPVRHAAARLARFGLAAGTLLAAATAPPRPAGATPGARSAPADDAMPPVAVMTLLEPGARSPAEHATTVWLSPAEAQPTVTPASTHTPGEPRPAHPPTEATWVVEHGDSFWSIAEETLTEAMDPAPSDAMIGHYWERLVMANRDRLVVSENTDLLRIGQELVLPPLR